MHKFNKLLGMSLLCTENKMCEKAWRSDIFEAHAAKEIVSERTVPEKKSRLALRRERTKKVQVPTLWKEQYAWDHRQKLLKHWRAENTTKSQKTNAKTICLHEKMPPESPTSDPCQLPDCRLDDSPCAAGLAFKNCTASAREACKSTSIKERDAKSSTLPPSTVRSYRSTAMSLVRTQRSPGDTFPLHARLHRSISTPFQSKRKPLHRRFSFTKWSIPQVRGGAMVSQRK